MHDPATGPPVSSPPEAPHPLLRIRLGPLLVLALLAFGVPVAAGLGRLPLPGGHDFVLVASALTYGLFVAWLAVAVPRAGVSWTRLFGAPPPPGRTFEIMLVAWMHILFAANSFVVILAVLHRLAPRLARELAEIAAMSHTLGSAPRPELILTMVVVAPVVEELLFRGVLLQNFALRWGAPRAVLASSAIFAALHPQHPLGLFVFSVLLSVLFLSTRSLAAAMLAHALTNGTLLLITHLAARGASVPETPEVSRMVAAAPAALVGLGLVGVFVGLYLRRRWPARDAVIPYDAVPVRV